MPEQWSPKRTLAEVEDILCAPGNMHEWQTCMVDGLMQRVYKNLWPSLRVFWLWATQEHKDKFYTIFENQRYTFSQVFSRSLKAAAIFHDVYGVRKGDRVAICSRNCPEYLVAFWACHLLGAVSTLPNAWSPLDILRYCLVNTNCKLIIVDPERADVLEPIAKKLTKEAGSTGILVLESREGKGKWNGMKTWEAAFNDHKGDHQDFLKMDPKIVPEDNATIIFTSGTTGLPKGVLTTQRQFLTNIFNVLVGSRRTTLRRGEDISQPPVGPQRAILLSVPLFHVTGLTSLAMLSTMAGMKLVLMRRWNAEEGARLIKDEDVAIAGGVPSMVSDLSDSSVAGYPLESMMFGGAPAPDSLAFRATRAFPTASLGQGYGLTETSGVAVSNSGEEYLARPASCGLPMPINDVKIMSDNTAVPVGTVGEVWLRGPNIMKGYWKDEGATQKALTKDGWFMTGDLGLLDHEGFLYIRDRIKDIIIRGGENIDSVTVENVFYADERVLEAAAVGIPDKRLGEQVAVVVSLKPAFYNKITEEELISLARKRLPRFAVPLMIVILNTPFERTPSGKILKPQLRRLAASEWSSRKSKL